MKNACSIALLFLGCMLTAQAQSDSTTFEAEPQFVFGLSSASASLDADVATSALLGFETGVAMDYQYSETTGITGALLYRQGGYSLDATQESVESWVLIKRFGFPLGIYVSPLEANSFIVRAGIEPGWLLSAVNKYKGSNGNTGESDISATFRSFALAGTMSVHVRTHSFLEIGVAYYRDFLSIRSSDRGAAYLQNISLQLRFIPNEFDG